MVPGYPRAAGGNARVTPSGAVDWAAAEPVNEDERGHDYRETGDEHRHDLASLALS